MSFVLETGEGVVGANMYIDDVYYKEYQKDRGFAINDGSSEIKRAAIRASEYMDKRWGRRLRGFQKTSTQGLAIPRSDAYTNSGWPINGVPEPWKKACAEYTRRALKLGILAPDPVSPVPNEDLEGTVTATEGNPGQVLEHREKLGPLEEETKYAQTSQSSSNLASKSTLVSDWTLPEYPEADLWIEEFLENSNSGDLARA